ncbi:unnamed protein product [Ilex paraguariensis]|uniref:Biotin carboxyl carrier protein of acetyl-CoA carboxylase n=1 Tax=Ilex paraguariensis TaxID=185542 RepID=A0ABC8UJ60_9AQUA
MKGLQSTWNRYTLVRAQLNEVRFFQWVSLEDIFSKFRYFMDKLLEPSIAFKVTVDGSSNGATTPSAKSEVPALDTNDSKPSNELVAAAMGSEESISEFITQVANLVKDIVELQLKQFGYELLIRKKEALLLPSSSAPVVMMHSSPPAVATLAFQAAPPVVPSAPSVPPPSTAATKSAKPSLPPLKCPMAGTFYQSPAPGEPPFVKVGDKVQKGQVLCIIEAMKLMNEIEMLTVALVYYLIKCKYLDVKLQPSGVE